MTTKPMLDVLLGCALLTAISGSGICRAGVVPFDSDRWETQAEETRIVEYQGKTSLYLDSGAAWLRDDAFANGKIEFDIAFSSARGFMGAMWRMREGGNYEHFYVRPHESGHPDANQYTPVFNNVSGWQLYHGPGYGVTLEYPYDQWIHMKILFKGGMGEVYIDSEEPVLVMPDLKHEVGPGLVGLTASFAPAYFANFQYEKSDGVELKGELPAAEPAPVGMVKTWMISGVLQEADLAGQTELPAGLVDELDWTPLASETSGITNLARVQGVGQEENTAFARIIIHSQSDQIKQLNFGYSDRVRVYLNSRVLYSGSNFYRSRDFRYLGTIGLFDSVYLPLREGDNELWFGVSESFGGWGILAQFEDTDGLELSP